MEKKNNNSIHRRIRVAFVRPSVEDVIIFPFLHHQFNAMNSIDQRSTCQQIYRWIYLFQLAIGPVISSRRIATCRRSDVELCQYCCCCCCVEMLSEDTNEHTRLLTRPPLSSFLFFRAFDATNFGPKKRAEPSLDCYPQTCHQTAVSPPPSFCPLERHHHSVERRDCSHANRTS